MTDTQVQPGEFIVIEDGQWSNLGTAAVVRALRPFVVEDFLLDGGPCYDQEFDLARLIREGWAEEVPARKLNMTAFAGVERVEPGD